MVDSQAHQRPSDKQLTRLLERRFNVQVPLEKAWAHLEQVEQWPSWARHIRRIELQPSKTLGPESEGTIELKNGISSTFKVEEFNVGHNWKWVGPFLWLKVHYDHQFQKLGPEKTAVNFVVDGEGLGVGLFGRIFAAIYARNLDRAIPRLIEELEQN